MEGSTASAGPWWDLELALYSCMQAAPLWHAADTMYWERKRSDASSGFFAFASFDLFG